MIDDGGTIDAVIIVWIQIFFCFDFDTVHTEIISR